jgi:transposase
LRRIYRQHGIKKKAVRQVKRQKPGSKRRWEITEEDILQQLNRSDAEGRLFLSCDETGFNKYTNSNQDWSRLRQNTEVDRQSAYAPPLTVIATISSKHGVDYYEILPEAVTTVTFLEYIGNLRKKHGKVPLTVLLDNLSAHHNVDVQELADQLDIQLVWNKQDCPEYAPIEMTFSVVKAHFKKIKLNRLANGRAWDMEDMIDEAFDRVSKETVRRQIGHARRLL